MSVLEGVGRSSASLVRGDRRNIPAHWTLEGTPDWDAAGVGWDAPAAGMRPPPAAASVRASGASSDTAAFPGWPTAKMSALPMPELAPDHATEAAALRYRQSGYVVLRDAVPADLLPALQQSFEKHTEAIVAEHGAGWRNYGGRFQIDALKEDESFLALTEVLTAHPLIVRLAKELWQRKPVCTALPYGSVHPGGEASNQSWHNVRRHSPGLLWGTSKELVACGRTRGILTARASG